MPRPPGPIERSAVSDYLAWAKEHLKIIDNDHDKIKLRCPFPDHPDTHASFQIDRRTGRFHCFGCGKSGSIKKLSSELKLPQPETDPLYRIDVEGLPDTYKIEAQQCHERLLKRNDIMERLEDGWCVRIEEIKRYNLGYCAQTSRITMPVYFNDQLVNIRKHKFAGGKGGKVIGVMGVREPFPFPQESLQAHKILICEGEKDALCACRHGFSAVTFTGGASARPSKDIARLFLGKTAVIAYDCDTAGQNGARNLTKQLTTYCDTIQRIDFTEDQVGKGGDVTDFILKYGDTAFRTLYNEARIVHPREYTQPALDDTVVEVSLSDSRKPGLHLRRCKVHVQVIGKQLQPFTFPHRGVIGCDDYAVDERKCALCALHSGSKTDNGQQLDVEIVEHEQSTILELIRVPTGAQKKALSVLLHLNCGKWIWVEQENLNVEQVIVSQDPHMQEFDDPPINHEAYVIGELPVNENLNYKLVGRQVVNPREQSVTHVFSEYEEKQSVVPLRDGESSEARLERLRNALREIAFTP